MNPSRYLQTVGLFALISGLVAFASLGLLFYAIRSNPDAMGSLTLLLDIPNLDLAALRWSMICDVFGYYLFLVPALFYLHEFLRPRTPWAGVATFCGGAYVLLGAMGAGIFAVAMPPLYTAHAAATPADRESTRLLFETVGNLVNGALWNLLEMPLAGVWWLVVGATMRQTSRAFGNVTFALGVFSLLDGLGNVFELKLLSEIGLNAYLVLAPVWASWLGVRLLRSAKKGGATTGETAQTAAGLEPA